MGVSSRPNFHIVIVGAGSAGCVLAARLSEDPGRLVLLVEAGPDYVDESALPPEIRSSLMPAFTHDWEYFSEPGLLDRPIHLARAKLVGGCSATNATFAVRGNPDDYDEWASLGNQGWSFSEVLPFFRRLENDADFDDEWHGRNGPLPIRRCRRAELTPAQGAFLQACKAAGNELIDDHNRPGSVGAGLAPTNAVSGIRQSTALTYLRGARDRPNLTVLGGTTVDRVVLEDGRACGVRLANSGETIVADRVILSAGAYGSPGILMRSGLGPATHLRERGIAVVEDLPGVGQNLIDHPLLGLRFSASPTPTMEPAPFAQTLLTAKSAMAHGPSDLHILPTSIVPDETSGSGGSFMLFVAVMKPISRGALSLRSADPEAAPTIDLGYLTHPDDLPRMVEAVRRARELGRTPPLSDLVVNEEYPGVRTSDADADLERSVRTQVETYHHAVGTCRMGPASDQGAVVDQRGNVHGVRGLSVVDASIMPTIPAANTNIPTMMVAERCAAWISETF